ncbi:MAG TPA: ABC-F type ribosomal protection protein [Oscillospiraceae bacterium]|nr:ABC-F type ribosomal protection protein [Oscillospiraceae bacterium]HPF56022.1 ABC-F type ribosomal protection protein [Clostridiales bacterium]HPK35512.1 ABC-F type ribosomal protection protein [Oscillospiraceae bacterium]HPR76050.1 ABC-F type ribosomal protection protein [Oscillospiraceae bacterium]
MIDIATYELNKYYGSNHVIKGITFEVYTGEKVGLLGRNGSGKTTLFKVLTGEELYESGSVSKASGKRVEMMAQIPEFGENDAVEDILRSSFQEITDIHHEMKQIEGDEDPSVLLRYGHLLEEYERLGGYETEVKLDKVCNGMNIDEKMRKCLFNQLSGGEKSRVNLARILLRDCDILLLDEPTNHLDLASLEWLEKFLNEFKGTVVVISHDRVFLDRVVTRIIEITDGKADFYAGNYSYFIEEKERRFLTQSEQYEQQQKKIRQLETAAKRMHEWAKIADNKAMHKRAFAMEKRIEQMDKVDKPVTAKKLTAEFDSGSYAAKELVAFDSVYKSYGEKVLLNHLDLKIRRNDRIALVGANGCGKTTLLRILMGEEPCDSGKIKLGPSVKPAYMPQIIAFENEGATVLDTLRFDAGLSEEKTRSILAGFHFKAADVMKKVGTLSGGEKSRLKLCMLMQNNVNFLLLDEPTNHLDIATREWIENALTDFEGTMLFVSHDRYFLNKFADRIWSMENGVITEYGCEFDEYLELTRPVEIPVNKPKATVTKGKDKDKIKIHPEKEIPTEDLIHEAETELKSVIAEIESDLQNADFQNMKALYEKKSQLEERIDTLYSEWVKNG